jgi:hypothetical protein
MRGDVSHRPGGKKPEDKGVIIVGAEGQDAQIGVIFSQKVSHFTLQQYFLAMFPETD